MRPETYSNQANVASAPKPTLSDEITVNDKRIQELHQRLSELEARLSPILRAVPPSTGASGGNEPAMPWSAVICALRKSGFDLEAASARVEDLISRLDV